MNLKEQTLQQMVAIVSLRPELDRRYRVLRDLLDACSERETEPQLWQIDLARADLEAVIDTMLPRIVEPEDED